MKCAIAGLLYRTKTTAITIKSGYRRAEKDVRKSRSRSGGGQEQGRSMSRAETGQEEDQGRNKRRTGVGAWQEKGKSRSMEKAGAGQE